MVKVSDESGTIVHRYPNVTMEPVDYITNPGDLPSVSLRLEQEGYLGVM